MRFRLPSPHWSARRRRLVTASLIAGLAIAAFYAEENLRGSWTLGQAIDLANAENVPLHPAALFVPAPPAERNLFHSPAFQNRLLWKSADSSEELGESSGLPAPIPWGDIHPRSTGTGRSRQLANTDVRNGRSRSLEATRDRMKALGWSVPETTSPAEDVRIGLDRFRNELAEWAVEIRKRPEWAPAPDSFGAIRSFDRVLEETTRMFALRAVARALAGRPDAEILDDLESAQLISRHVWSSPGLFNEAVWEVLRARRLDDTELVLLACLLPDKPFPDVLLKRTWMESLAWIHEILTPLSSGDAGDASSHYWELYTVLVLQPEHLPPLRRLKPAGWFRLEEARMLEVMVENGRWLRQVETTWDLPSALPVQREKLEPPFVARGNLHYMDDLGYHLQSCGCPVSTIVNQAVEARLAMVAIGLERYRLRHGTWPPTLTEAADLIPRGLRPDPQSGKPLTYKILPEGGWELSNEEHYPVWRMILPP